MKRILLLLFVVISFAAQSQITRNQSYDWRNLQIFSDSVKMDSLYGSGTILRIDENGYIYRSSGTNVDTIPIGQVLGLRSALDSLVLTVDSNFNLSGSNFLSLNDSIWVEYANISEYAVAKNLDVINPSSAAFNVSSSGSFPARIFLGDFSTGDRAGEIRFISSDSTNDFSARIRRVAGKNGKFIIQQNEGNEGLVLRSVTNVDAISIDSSGVVTISEVYSLPVTSGTSGQVLTTNGSSAATWGDVTSPLIAGTNITISNDTISASTSTDSDWTTNGNYVYNLTDSIGIGVSDPDVDLEINGRVKMSNANPTLTVTNTGGSAALTLVSSVAGDAIDLNNHLIDSVSNDVTLADNDQNDLVTEYAVKQYVDERILNDTRVSWAADVDTSARIDGFVLKWNAGAGTHYYDTAGTGGGGSTYFAGDGLSLSANVFSIGTDSVKRYMIQDTAISYSKIQRVSPHSVLARVAGTDGSLSEVSLGTSQLLGRGSSGNIAPISLSGLTMVGTTLTNSNTGTVTNIAAGNGMDFSSITTTGTVTMGTPTTLTGSSTNATTTTSHTHQLDFGTFKSNSYGFFLDTERMEERDSAVTITTEEKVILFTMSENIDSVLLGSGYFTMSARVVINAVNNDTLSGTVALGGNLPKYTIKAYLVDNVQTLGSVISGSKTELRTARVIDMFTALKNGESTAEGILTMTMNTNPTKFRMTGGFFVAVTISATYGGVTDYVKHEDASMVIEKANDYDENIEQIFD